MEKISYSVRILFLMVRIMFLVSNRKLDENKGKRVQIRRNCVLCCKASIILGAERTPLYKKDKKCGKIFFFAFGRPSISKPSPLPPPQRPVLSGFSDPPPGGQPDVLCECPLSLFYCYSVTEMCYTC